MKRFGINWRNPYTFYKDSCFISQFYIGQNGVWLSTNYQNIDELLNEKESLEPIKYHSHNVDIPEQAYVLMSLFSQWVEFSEAIRG